MWCLTLKHDNYPETVVGEDGKGGEGRIEWINVLGR